VFGSRLGNQVVQTVPVWAALHLDHRPFGAEMVNDESQPDRETTPVDPNTPGVRLRGTVSARQHQRRRRCVIQSTGGNGIGSNRQATTVEGASSCASRNVGSGLVGGRGRVGQPESTQASRGSDGESTLRGRRHDDRRARARRPSQVRGTGGRGRSRHPVQKRPAGGTAEAATRPPTSDGIDGWTPDEGGEAAGVGSRASGCGGRRIGAAT